MNYYMVFGSIKRPRTGGGSYLDWSQHGPIGVYEAATPDDACQLAAADEQTMGNFFAIQGSPWGVALMDTPGGRFGSQESAMDKLERKLSNLDKLDQVISRLLPPPSDAN